MPTGNRDLQLFKLILLLLSHLYIIVTVWLVSPTSVIAHVERFGEHCRTEFCALNAICSSKTDKCECKFGYVNYPICLIYHCEESSECIYRFPNSACNFTSNHCVCDQVNGFRLDDSTQRCILDDKIYRYRWTNVWLWIIPLLVTSSVLTALGMAFRFYYVNAFMRKQIQRTAQQQQGSEQLRQLNNRGPRFTPPTASLSHSSNRSDLFVISSRNTRNNTFFEIDSSFDHTFPPPPIYDHLRHHDQHPDSNFPPIYQAKAENNNDYPPPPPYSET